MPELTKNINPKVVEAVFLDSSPSSIFTDTTSILRFGAMVSLTLVQAEAVVLLTDLLESYISVPIVNFLPRGAVNHGVCLVQWFNATEAIDFKAAYIVAMVG